MASSTNLPVAIETATTLREEGNAFYKAGKLFKACQKYSRAIELDPRDPLPRRNLSACFYELGHYQKCTRAGSKAAIIAKACGGDDLLAQLQKLDQRMEKAKFHSFQAPESEQIHARAELLKSPGRYRPSMITSKEFFSVGHDLVTSLFDIGAFDMVSPKAESVAFFLGGVGDARNLLQTISFVADKEKTKELPKKRKYHFTINDVHKTALARNLIIWILLEEWNGLKEDDDEATLIMNTVFFVFISSMMPPYIFERLNAAISKAIEILQSGKQPFKWLFLRPEDVPSYIVALSYWYNEARVMFTSADIVQRVISEMRSKDATGADITFATPSMSKTERHSYLKGAMLYPSNKILELRDAELMGLIKNNSSTKSNSAVVMKKHVENNWHFNTTLLDKGWSATSSRGLIKQIDVGFDPFEIIVHFPYDEVSMKPQKPDRLFEHLSPFFVSAAKSIKYLGERLKIEVILGDYLDVVEKIRFGLYRESRPADFPALYDRMHISNVPDYTNGHLSTFLHAMPLLRRSPASNLKANCLRNAGSFSTVNDYLAEYNLTTSDKMLFQLFQVNPFIRENSAMQHPMADFSFYTWSSPEPLSDYEFLLHRKGFHRWFYSLFFRIALPFNQDLWNNTTVILSPLNMTVIFHILIHLRGFGYPSHWLSEVLLNIINNNVVTTCRPPRISPSKVADVKREHPERKISTTPFVEEMTVLARKVQPLLPFCLPPSSTIIPKAGDTAKYTFHIPHYEDIQTAAHCLVLVFINVQHINPGTIGEKGMHALKGNLRQLLDSSWGEVDSIFEGEEFEHARAGLSVHTAWEWDTEKNMAIVELNKGTFPEKISWTVGIWRSDTWACCCGMPISFNESLTNEIGIDMAGFEL